MYKISNVRISGFWHRFDAGCEFVPGVNIIIGKNGTGKTTFMNILHATLAVDLDSISANEFDSATVYLSDGAKNRTISVTKIEDERFPFLILEYKISNRKFKIRVFSAEDARLGPHYRRRQLEESAHVRDELSKIVSLSSLSVYRLRSSDDYEVRDRSGRRIVSPVDYRLDELMQRLTHYQLELSNLANQVSTRLQKDVLTSILYGKEDSEAGGLELAFNKEEEKSNLISAYTQLNAIDAEVRRKITFHVEAVRSAIEGLDSIRQSHKKGEERPEVEIDFQSLEALRGTRKIIEKSLRAKKDTSDIFSQIDKFLARIMHE